MSPREVATVVLGIASLVALGVTAATHVVRAPARWAVQVVAGLACGLICAVVASAPYVDLVPDDSEAGAGIAAVLLAVVAGASWARRRAGAHPASRRRSPGDECASASSEHSGP